MSNRSSDDAALRSHFWLCLKATSELHIALIRALDGYDVWEKVPTSQTFEQIEAIIKHLDVTIEELVALPAWHAGEPSDDE